MSLDMTLKAIGLRKKTPADKVREAGANLNARFAKLRGATPASRALQARAADGADGPGDVLVVERQGRRGLDAEAARLGLDERGRRLEPARDQGVLIL